MILIEKSWVMFRFPLYCSSKDILLEDGSREISFFYIFPLQFIPSAFFSRGCPPELQRNPTPSSPTKEAVKLNPVTTCQEQRDRDQALHSFKTGRTPVMLATDVAVSWRSFGGSIFHGFSGWWFETFFIFTPTWENDPIWLIFFKWVETTN